MVIKYENAMAWLTINVSIIQDYCLCTSNLVIQLTKTGYTTIDPVLFSSWSEKLYEHNKVCRMARCWEDSTTSTGLVYRAVVTWHWHKLYLKCSNWQKIWRSMYNKTTLLCLFSKCSTFNSKREIICH